jgi:hypothetical protein
MKIGALTMRGSPLFPNAAAATRQDAQAAGHIQDAGFARSKQGRGPRLSFYAIVMSCGAAFTIPPHFIHHFARQRRYALD